jgi:predicted transcriptional regulator
VNQSILEMTKDLVKSQIEHQHISPERLQQALQNTYANLLSLKAQEDRLETGDAGYAQEVPKRPAFVNWKKSITKHAITCLECGQSFKQLSRRHLSQHGLDGRSYRLKYGMPRTQPLSAKATTAKRREVAQTIKPWEQTPRALRAKAEQAKAAKKAVRRTRRRATTVAQS